MKRVKFKVVRRGRRLSLFAEGSYRLEYLKGSIVRARRGTLGVAVFKTRKQAEDFQEKYMFLEIIHVRPIGRGRTVRSICSDPSEIQLDTFYYGEIPVRISPVPSGTIFYPAVEVLD